MKIFILILFFSIGVQSVAKGENPVSPEEIIKKLNLVPLPEEGGYYRETYRSDYGQNPGSVLGIETEDVRTISTAIYYLVSANSFSAIHRIISDEVFHFYAGDPVEMIQIDENGNLETFILGSDVMAGHQPQVVVPRGVWQALRLVEGGSWGLMGTTVAPGFEFADFEVGTREQMLNAFPQHRETIIRYTRDENERIH